jgi:hypothetical protein
MGKLGLAPSDGAGQLAHCGPVLLPPLLSLELPGASRLILSFSGGASRAGLKRKKLQGLSGGQGDSK